MNRKSNLSPDHAHSNKGIPAAPVAEIVTSLKDKIMKIKQNKCLDIWNRIKQGKDDDKLQINDQLWSAVRNAFEDSLSCSLIKFLSSFICQTGCFELSKSFFLFNLSAASDQKKFFLHESLFDLEIREIEELVSRLDTIVTGDTSHRINFDPNKQSRNSKNMKKTPNMVSWFNSDLSILDSQPQTTKVTIEGNIQTDRCDKTQDNKYMRSKRRSISETRIAEFKSPDLDQKKIDYLKSNHLITSTAATRSKEMPIDVKRKKVRKSNHDNANMIKQNTRSKRRPKSRESSLKFLTDRTQNVFGEKLSIQLAGWKKSALNALKKEKSLCKDKLATIIEHKRSTMAPS